MLYARFDELVGLEQGKEGGTGTVGQNQTGQLVEAIEEKLK